jgi:hypothetical protein
MSAGPTGPRGWDWRTRRSRPGGRQRPTSPHGVQRSGGVRWPVGDGRASAPSSSGTRHHVRLLGAGDDAPALYALAVRCTPSRQVGRAGRRRAVGASSVGAAASSSRATSGSSRRRTDPVVAEAPQPPGLTGLPGGSGDLIGTGQPALGSLPRGRRGGPGVRITTVTSARGLSFSSSRPATCTDRVEGPGRRLPWGSRSTYRTGTVGSPRQGQRDPGMAVDDEPGAC